MIVESIFGSLASPASIQGLIDGNLQSMYGQSIWRKYMTWGVPQLELTFETVIGRKRIAAAASLVDPDSPSPLRNPGILEKLTGKIPTMKEGIPMHQDEYRKLLALQNMPISEATIKNELIKVLDNRVESVSIATDYRLDIMFLQAVTTFKLNVSVLNNPDGVAFGEIDLLAAPHQIRGVVKSWDHNDNDADIFKDISNTVNAAKAKGRKFKEIWIDHEKWLKVINNSTVVAKLKSFYRQAVNVEATKTLINNYMAELELPPFVVFNESRVVEIDGEDTTINPFEKDNIVFIPDGKLGIMHNAIAIEEIQPIEGINYAKYDRALISQWRENNPWAEFTGVELSACPALEAIDGIYLQKTTTVAG